MKMKIEDVFHEVKEKNIMEIKSRFEKIRDESISFWKNDERMAALAIKDFEDALLVLETIQVDVAAALHSFWDMDSAARDVVSKTFRESLLN